MARRPRMTRDELQRLYADAGSVAGVAERLGVSRNAAAGRLRRAGVLLGDVDAVGASAVDREWWQQRYIEAGSVSELARREGMTRHKVEAQLHRHGVEIQVTGYASPRTVPTPTGSDHFNWRGGLTMHSDGYVLEYAPDHPWANKGYVLQHRLVMERHLGYVLEPDELVHHRNEIKTDNRLENLELMSRSAHISLHKIPAPRDAKGRFTYVAMAAA